MQEILFEKRHHDVMSMHAYYLNGSISTCMWFLTSIYGMVWFGLFQLQKQALNFAAKFAHRKYSNRTRDRIDDQLKFVEYMRRNEILFEKKSISEINAH